MNAWVLGVPGELKLTNKPVPVPKRAEVLVRIDAAAICATDLEVIYQGLPAMIEGGLPFNKNFTPGHEYMGTVAALDAGVDDAIKVVVKAKLDAAQKVATEKSNPRGRSRVELFAMRAVITANETGRRSGGR